MNYLIEFDYVAEETDELSIVKGDVVTEVRDSEDGWVEGLLGGRRGVFPSNFGKLIQVENNNIGNAGNCDNPLFNEIEEKKPQGIVVEEQRPQSKKVMGVGFGNIFSGKQIQLKHANESRPQLSEDNQKTEANIDKRMTVGSVGKVELVKATFAYRAENPDELQMEDGDIITIIDKKNTDEGWWKGKLNGKVGMFPNNFVESYRVEEVPKPHCHLVTRKNLPPAPLTTKPKTKITPFRPLNAEPAKVMDKNILIKHVEPESEEINFDSPASHKPLVGPTVERVRRQNIRLPKQINTLNNNVEACTATLSSEKSMDSSPLESSITKVSTTKKPLTLIKEKSDEDVPSELKPNTLKSSTVKDMFSEILPSETLNKFVSSRNKSKEAADSDVFSKTKVVKEKSKESSVITGNFETASEIKAHFRPKSQFCSSSFLQDYADEEDVKKKIIALEIKVTAEEESNASLRKELTELCRITTAQLNDLTSIVNELLNEIEEEKASRICLEEQVKYLKTRVKDAEQS